MSDVPKYNEKLQKKKKMLYKVLIKMHSLWFIKPLLLGLFLQKPFLSTITATNFLTLIHTYCHYYPPNKNTLKTHYLASTIRL